MMIGGLQKFSLLDFPGRLSAIVFTKGCNFRCHYCYNPMLVWPTGWDSELKYQNDHFSIIEDDLFDFLDDRRGKLDGVVVTGGEPTLHKDLPNFLRKIRAKGFAVKLDTNGTNPAMLGRLLADGLVDYLAMDVKAALDRYEEVTGVATNKEAVAASIDLIMASDLPHEFRTTAVPGLFGEADAKGIGQLVAAADNWFIQGFKADTDLVDPAWQGKRSFARAELEELAAIGRQYAPNCRLRT
jgi:pyruvate formate lyase activating enzyme